MAQTKNIDVRDLGVANLATKEDVKVDQVSACQICSSEGGGLICD